VYNSGGWSFYVPVKKGEKPSWQKESMCFIIATEKQTYRINIEVPSVFDKVFILNSFVVEGKQLQFNFDRELVRKVLVR